MDARLNEKAGIYTIYVNPATKKTSAVPRYSEISDYLVKAILDELGIPKS